MILLDNKQYECRNNVFSMRFVYENHVYKMSESELTKICSVSTIPLLTIDAQNQSNGLEIISLHSAKTCFHYHTVRIELKHLF